MYLSIGTLQVFGRLNTRASKIFFKCKAKNIVYEERWGGEIGTLCKCSPAVALKTCWLQHQQEGNLKQIAAFR
jgi:hypothetical protein